MSIEYDKSKILREAAEALYPIKDGRVISPIDSPKIELSPEEIAKELNEDGGFRRLGAIVLIGSSIAPQINTTQQLRLPLEDNHPKPTSYRLSDYYGDLPTLTGDPNKYFIGPLILNGEFYPTGIGVYEALPEDS